MSHEIPEYSALCSVRSLPKNPAVLPVSTTLSRVVERKAKLIELCGL